MIKRQTAISGNIVQFCRFLRGKGFSIGVEEEALALEALRYIDFNDPAVFALALKSICCRSRAQQNEFDDLFNEYWKLRNELVNSKTKTGHKPATKRGTADATFKTLKSWIKGNRNEQSEEMAFYSAHENLSRKDFSMVPAGEVEELMRNISELSKKLAAQASRRYNRSGKTYLPDLRRTVRKNMRYGGELLEIALRKPRPNKTKLVVICDVSKSMDLYSAFLLQFMFGFSRVYKRVETFTFSTSLQCITGILKQDSFEGVLSLLNAQTNSWGGGTRIGESLQQFVEGYAGRLLDKYTIVIILSDGWDTCNTGALEESMALMQARSKKIIWLNPVANFDTYQPTAAGMKAAMPFIDVFAPVHNADSLRKLSQWLS